MDLLEQVIPEAIGALLATAILAFLAWLGLRHRSRKRYLPDLTAESKEILIGLWDGLLRRPNKLAEEFSFDERMLKKSLNQLASYGLVSLRPKPELEGFGWKQLGDKRGWHSNTLI